MAEALAMISASDREWILDWVAMCVEMFNAAGRIDGAALVIGSEGRTLIPMLVNSEAGMDRVAQMIRYEAVRMRAELVVTVHEAWVATFPSAASAQPWIGKPVKDMPGASHAVHFTAETLAAACHGAAPIERHAGSARLGEIKWHPATQAAGRFANLIPRTTTTREGVN
jgi:hypothetical protein